MNLPRLLLRGLLGERLPVTSGTLAVPGIAGPVVVKRDGWGIPHVEAQHELDAWYALGFCQGQDRPFQLELLLRLVRGTLAELVGPGGLAVDRLARRVGFLRAAERQLEVLDADIRPQIQAFVAGLNAGAKRGLRRRSHEFVLLRAARTPWTPADVLGFGKLQSFLLPANWDVELARLKILTEDGPEALAALDPAYPEWLPVTSPPGAVAGPAVDRLAEDLQLFAATIGTSGGSNNWALAPARTATGRALVANDPHLGPVLPAHWYLAHLKTPSWSIAGATFVGLPMFPAAHNGYGAWGLTAGLVDDTDFFLEELGPDGRSVRQGDEFVPCEVVVERIAVKGGAAVTEEVVVTPRGPIVSPALQGEVGAVSLRATWLDARPVRGFFDLPRARSFDDFRAAFRAWPASSQNMVYADVSGQVGWQMIGRAPRRRQGWGTLPLPGWDPRVGWEDDPVAFEAMPYLQDPPEGFVATANNRPVQDSEVFLGADWLDGYREARIVEELARRADWSVAAVQALQTDELSLPWRELRAIVLAAPRDDPAACRALELLEAWDGRVAADSPAAAVFELFVAEMAERVARARAPRSYAWALGRGFTTLLSATLFSARRVGHLVRLLRDQPAGWFDRPWSAEIADALGTAVRRLQTLYGPESAGWAWGRVRPLTLRHALGARKPLDRIYNLGPVPWGGDACTINQAPVDPRQPTSNPGAIASLRMVVDVGAWDESRWVLPGGQSGNPFSPHYADQFPLWLRGQGVPIAWSEAAVEQATRATLRLVPAGAPPGRRSRQG